MSQEQRAERQPPSRKIAEAIRDQIESGELQPGALLPSERELAARYGAARNTAREAFRLLEAAGLVDIEHGSGVFVHRPAPLIRLGSDRTPASTATPGSRRSCWNAPSRARPAGSRYSASAAASPRSTSPGRSPSRPTRSRR